MQERAAISPLSERHERTPVTLKRYADLFVVNHQIHARQTEDGRYYKVDEPVTYGLIRRHLRGEFTLGLYATSPYGDRVKWVCLDHDGQEGLSELADIARGLEDQEILGLLEGSRRGGHLWVFFDHAPTIAAREYFRHLVADEELDVEIFPKAEDGLSLVRAPLGVHRRAGRRYPFYDPSTLQPVSRSVMGNLEYLTQVERADVGKLAEGLAVRLRETERALASAANTVDVRREGDRDRSEIVALKEGIGDLRGFIGGFVELNAKGRGSCPFHPPDRRSSFAVHETFWVCFHENNPETGRFLGGDVIDFWIRYKDVDFPTALAQLSRLVE